MLCGQCGAVVPGMAKRCERCATDGVERASGGEAALICVVCSAKKARKCDDPFPICDGCFVENSATSRSAAGDAPRTPQPSRVEYAPHSYWARAEAERRARAGPPPSAADGWSPLRDVLYADPDLVHFVEALRARKSELIAGPPPAGSLIVPGGALAPSLDTIEWGEGWLQDEWLADRGSSHPAYRAAHEAYLAAVQDYGIELKSGQVDADSLAEVAYVRAVGDLPGRYEAVIYDNIGMFD